MVADVACSDNEYSNESVDMQAPIVDGRHSGKRCYTLMYEISCKLYVWHAIPWCFQWASFYKRSEL